jgi:transcription initiation factor IIE alpha subunit
MRYVQIKTYCIRVERNYRGGMMGETFSLNWYIYRIINNQVGQREYYQCGHCGYRFPREEAKVSGYDTAHSSRHVHCPRCGKIVTRAP